MSADAIVVGSGPNGLAAAITLAEAGRSVIVFEGAERVGGGTRSEELTLPGYTHDVCSAIHPFAVASPFLSGLPLAAHGLEWIYPQSQVAHPLDDGSAVMIERSLEDTVASFGADGRNYRRLVGSLVRNWTEVSGQLLGPALRFPRHPLRLSRFGIPAALPAKTLAKLAFKGQRARAVFAGLAAHAILPLERPLTASFGLVFGASAHVAGWPLPRSGSQRIADAMAAYLTSLGGEVQTGRYVESLDDLPKADAYLLDLTPAQVLRVAGHRFPDRYRRRLRRFRYGAAAFKVDYALDGPVPWKAEECARSATVHLGGTLEEVADAEAAVGRGHHPDRPFVLIAQQSLFDPSRAPSDKHTLWAYCHVPNGSSLDMSERIEAQIERFAPGFRDLVLQRHVLPPAALERHDPNYVGGDIAGGSHGGLQLIARPTLSARPYATPARGIYLCSASTPPGAGVHGMCGYYAAKTALSRSLS